MNVTSQNSRSGHANQLPDLLCFSHLRWDFVYQRPQHLMSRWAKERRVFFIEEAKCEPGLPRLEVRQVEDGLRVVVPTICDEWQGESRSALKQRMLDQLMTMCNIRNYISWYYTPMAMDFSRHLKPQAIIYDCMDELSAFRGAPRAMRENEAELLQRADVVFTGGHSLYEAKRHMHRNIHPFPSSIDQAHFAQARTWVGEPQDQAAIPHPRLGFYGVLDERLDIALLDGIAQARPDWQIVMLGPIVKIDPNTLPRHANIHYLGMKNYQELPAYLAGWDVALLLFAQNEATRFISPTKTPEYLAGGKPVVSTPIRDVVRPYGEQGLVHIADTPSEFVAAIDTLLAEGNDRHTWQEHVDTFLADLSWDHTWAMMKQKIDAACAKRRMTAAA